MGILRLLLAMSVVAGHAEAFFRRFFFINAKAAVLCFFVISGFYMALVLNEKYDSRITFLVNRWLRIYCPYIVVTLLFGAYLYAAGRFKLDWATAALNIGLLGQDVVRMLHWHPIPVTQDRLGVDTIVIPQAWTLAVELQLYVVAAIFFPLRHGCWWVLGLGVAGRLGAWHFGYAAPPYEIMLVANVLLLFAFGGLSYLIYRRIRTEPFKANLAIAAGIIAVLALYLNHFDGFTGQVILINGIAHARIPYPEADLFAWKILPLYGLTAALVPFLFAVTKDLKADKLLGELSYPVYLCHIVVIDTAQRAGVDPFVQRWVVPIATLAVAVLIYVVVDRPLDAIRNRWSRRTRT
jgi:peptidoglycan/LPS O-acetylase OafA/YrhL